MEKLLNFFEKKLHKSFTQSFDQTNRVHDIDMSPTVDDAMEADSYKSEANLVRHFPSD